MGNSLNEEMLQDYLREAGHKLSQRMDDNVRDLFVTGGRVGFERYRNLGPMLGFEEFIIGKKVDYDVELSKEEYHVGEQEGATPRKLLPPPSATDSG